MVCARPNGCLSFRFSRYALNYLLQLLFVAAVIPLPLNIDIIFLSASETSNVGGRAIRKSPCHRLASVKERQNNFMNFSMLSCFVKKFVTELPSFILPSHNAKPPTPPPLPGTFASTEANQIIELSRKIENYGS